MKIRTAPPVALRAVVACPAVAGPSRGRSWTVRRRGAGQPLPAHRRGLRRPTFEGFGTTTGTIKPTGAGTLTEFAGDCLSKYVFTYK